MMGFMAEQSSGRTLGQRLRGRDLSAAPKAVSLLEDKNRIEEAKDLMAEVSLAKLGSEASGHTIGITGPPGVGKSSLISGLIAHWRREGLSVAMLAIDPSSRYSGGALLGDRARIDFDPEDHGVFIRSSAAGESLGGLAWSTHSAAMALAAAFDIVVIETVGVGQSEADIADTADSIVVVIQPGSGDTLQYLKAGIMEVPDILAVNKMDLGALSQVTFSILRMEARSLGKKGIPVIATSALAPTRGIDGLASALEEHKRALDVPRKRKLARRANAYKMLLHEYGQQGIRSLGGQREIMRLLEAQSQETSALELFAVLTAHL